MPDYESLSAVERGKFWDWVRKQYGSVPYRFHPAYSSYIEKVYPAWVSMGRPDEKVEQATMPSPVEPTIEEPIGAPAPVVEPREAKRIIYLPDGTSISVQWGEIEINGLIYDLPILPYDVLNGVNVQYVLRQLYGIDYPIDLFRAVLQGSLLTHAREKWGITPEEILGSEGMMGWIEEATNMWMQGRQMEGGNEAVVDQLARLRQAEAPGAAPIEPLEKEVPTIPHYTRMQQIGRLTDEDARAQYESDIKLMKQAADTGDVVRLSTGVQYSAADAGFFPEKIPEVGTVTEAPGGQYYTGKQGITVVIPDVTQWSGEAFTRWHGYKDIPIPEVTPVEKYKLGALAPEEEKEFVFGQRMAYPKGTVLGITRQELMGLRGELTKEKLRAARGRLQESVSGYFTEGGKFIEAEPHVEVVKDEAAKERRRQEEEWNKLMARAQRRAII